MKHPITQLICAFLITLPLMTTTGCKTAHSFIPDQASLPFTSIELREGDILKISFPGSPNLTTSQQIRRDGKIVMPMGGDLKAAGLTPSQLEAELIKAYGNQLVSKEVIVTVETSVYDVFVTGAVLKPGKVTANRPISALEAIMEAGGFDYAKADLKQVSIIRHERDEVQNYKVNLKTMMERGVNRTFYLRPSDIVYVPEKFSFF
jgi:polysaccharide biosynthesis/export protein